jgi:hypothetical protein
MHTGTDSAGNDFALYYVMIILDDKKYFFILDVPNLIKTVEKKKPLTT